MKTFPTLYQKTNTGAIQQWTISASVDESTGWPLGVITYVFGQVGGALQTGSDTIKEGKNIGKKNETSPVEQALKEAEARWTKQKKKGYVESIEDAQAGKVDTALILGGIEPMLAPNKSYPKDPDLEKAITYPCYFQPKLDGMRCIAVIEDGVATVWSRTRKPIPTIPHIVEALGRAFPTGKITLDGELYNHDYKDRFEDLMSILRGDAPDAEGEYMKAELHIYDCPERYMQASHHTMDAPFEHRNMAVDKSFENISLLDPLKRVVTILVNSMDDLKQKYEEALVNGYEGGMARNANGKYESGKRSKNLQKMKEFEEAEFPVIGIEDGRGKDAGTAATIVVRLPNGKDQPVRLKKPYAYRRKIFQTPSMWQGKILTVTFKRWTAAGMLYIPTSKGFRDYE